jgi:hypothetical protein
MTEAMASIRESISDARTLKEPVKNHPANLIPISRNAVTTEAVVASFKRDSVFSSDEKYFIELILVVVQAQVNSCVKMAHAAAPLQQNAVEKCGLELLMSFYYNFC